MTTAQRIFSNTGWQWLDKGITASFRFASLALASNYLGDAGFGEYSLILIFITFFAFLTDFGLDDTVIKYLSKNDNQVEKALGNLVIVKTLLSIVSIAACIGTAMLLGYAGPVVLGMALAAPAILLYALSSVGFIYFRLRLKMQYVSVANIAGAFVLLGLVLAIVRSGGNIFHLILAYGGACLVTFLLTAFFLYRDTGWEWSALDSGFWKPIGTAALPLGVAYLLANIYGNVDTVILSRMTSFDSVGVYTAAYRFMFFGTMVPVAFVNSIFPLMTRFWHEDKRAFESLVEHAFEVLILIGGPMAVSIWYLAPKLMSIFGPDFIRGAVALRWLVPAMALMFPAALATGILIAADKQKFAPLIGSVGVAVNVGLNLLLIPNYDLVAPAMVTSITETVTLILLVSVILEHVKLSATIAGLFRALTISLICAGALTLTQPWGLIWQIAVLGLTYVLAIMATGGIEIDSGKWVGANQAVIIEREREA